MKINRSLGVSTKIQAILNKSNLGLLDSVYPSSLCGAFGNPDNGRDRVYTVSGTLQTMLITATMQDKSLKNSVNLHYISHQKSRELEAAILNKNIQEEKQKAGLVPRKAGRPRLFKAKLRKSKTSNHSLNTAAYSKARKRVPQALTDELFGSSIIENAKNDYSHWFGRRVFIGDGTYVQMQDTGELRKKYAVKHNGAESKGYPQGLLEAISERGTGQVFSYGLSNRHTGELELFYGLMDGLPRQSILLLDDLYNTYETFAKLESLGVKIVVPGKRKRKYSVIGKIGEGDEIVKIKKPKARPSWLPEDAIGLPGEITLRRIECISPEGKEYVLYTSVLDENIKKGHIINLYFTRWDVEVSIREIKTIMDINILRSKSEDMIRKELAVSLSAYNLIRKVIYESIKDMPFSPKESLVQEFYSLNKNILVDKKGRVYNKWSTGRKRNKANNTKRNIAQSP